MTNADMDALHAAVKSVANTDAEYVITESGRPSAVLVGFSRYDSLVETINIMSDPDAMAAIAEAEGESTNA